jgi:hypothetical protein
MNEVVGHPQKRRITPDMMLIGGYVRFAPGVIAQPLEHLVGPSRGALGECGLPRPLLTTLIYF